MAAFRRDIGSRIQPRIKEFAHIIGLPRATSQFEQDVIEAVQWCILASFESLRPKRYGTVRKDLLKFSAAAQAVEKSLRRMRAAYESLSPQSRDSLTQVFGLSENIALGIVVKQDPWFSALSLVAGAAELYAEALKGMDKGGVQQNIPFRMFVLYLARAFKNATGREAKVTWSEYKGCYTGPFVNFVEAVLSLTVDWPERLGGTPSCPRDHRTRGKYIYDLTRAGAGKRKTAR